MRMWTDRKVTLGVLLYLCLSGSGNGQSGKPRESREEELFRTAGLPSDNAGVLAYLKERARAADEVDRVDELVRQLGHARFAVRQQAKAQVIALGAVALPALQQQFNNKDPELAQNAKACAAQIEAGASETHNFLLTAGVRLLTRRKAEGAVEALLRYLPLAQQAELETEIYYSLDELAVRAGKVHPALAAALADKVAARRAVSACIVGRVGGAEQKAAVRKLLSDADARVRLRAAQGLLAGKDASGVAALVALVDDAPLPLAWEAEELLRWVAGDSSPGDLVGNGSRAERQRCREKWEKWLNGEAHSFDLSLRQGDDGQPGFILVCERGSELHPSGSVQLRGSDGATRWQLTRLLFPSDVRLLPGERVLVAECDSPAHQGTARPVQGGVSERKFDGTIVWHSQTIRNPTTCVRLHNGNTFIAERFGRAIEVTKTGEERALIRPTRPGPITFEFPQALPDGQVFCREQRTGPEFADGLMAFDRHTGLERGRVRFGGGLFTLVPQASVEPLANGHFLLAGVAGALRNCVIEVDGAGAIVWKCPVPGAVHALRHTNGNTVIAAGNRVVEVTAQREIVRDIYCPQTIHRIQLAIPLVRLGFNHFPVGKDRPRAGSVIPIEGLRSKDKEIRRRTIAYLAEFGSDIPGAIKAMTDLLDDPDPIFRGEARKALGILKQSPLSTLLARLEDQNPETRADAAFALGSHGAAAAVVAPMLTNAYRDDNVKVRTAVINSLGAMTFEAEIVVPVLMKAAKDRSPEVRQVAAHSLRRLGAAALPAVPVLIEGLRDQNITVKNWSAMALGSIGPIDRRILPALLKALHDPEVRAGAALGISALRAEAEAAVPALIEAFHAPKTAPPHWQQHARESIVFALGRIGPRASPALPILLDIIRDNNASEGYRADAIRSVGLMRQRSSEVQSVLQAVARAKGNDSLSPLASAVLLELQSSE